MSSTIKGHVLDNSQKPVSKVKISFKGKTVAESGDDGFFVITSKKTKNRVALTFIKEGFVNNTRVFDATSNSSNTVIIFPIAYTCKFNPSRDLDIVLGGSGIQVPANSLVDLNGKEIKDNVELQFTWFDITNRFQRAAAPGDFSGKMLDGRIARLNSYGIFDFGIYDQEARLLKLRPKAKIDLSIAVPPRISKQAPKNVGYFSFDTFSGRWIQLGNFDFIPQNLTYNGSVDRFGGAYNLDDDLNTTCITIRVIRIWDSAPMPNFSVVAHGLQYDSYGTTDANGFVCLLVQRNASFTVESYGSIGSTEYGTPTPPTFTAPDISSDADDCGDPDMCPLLGVVEVDMFVGLFKKK